VSLYVQMIRSVAQLGCPMVVLDMKHVALRLMARRRWVGGWVGEQERDSAGLVIQASYGDEQMGL
jgi:hypothetical protein